MSDGTTKVSIRAAARVLDVSDTALHKARRDGRCTFNDDGTVDVEKVRLQLAANTNPVRGGRRRPNDDQAGASELPKVPPRPSAISTMADARLRRELAEARRAELDLAHQEGRLGDRAAMTAEFVRHVVSARQQLQAIPMRVAAQIAAETDVRTVAHVLDAEIARVCSELSKPVE